MTIDSKLQAILDAATAKANAAGDSQELQAIQLLEKTINDSPELAAEMNATADAGNFVAINWITGSKTSEASTDPSGTGMDINIGSVYFENIEYETQAAQLLGHENYHITHESIINNDYQNFLQDIAAFANGNSSKTADDIIKEFELFNNQNEGGANITGINDAINAYELAHNESSLSADDIKELLREDPSASLAFNADLSLKSGFVQDANGDGLLDFSQSLGAATMDAGTTLSSGGASGINDNNEYYAAFAISDLSSKIGQGQMISLDYAGDGLLYNAQNPN
jgi:hypothetical protein